MHPKIQKVLETLKKWNTFFCQGMTCKTNLKRDVILIGVYALALVFLVISVRFNLFRDRQPEKVEGVMDAAVLEGRIYEDVKVVRETIDVTKWKTHQSQWYGIEVKYPENWILPQVQGVPRGAAWEYRYQFRKKTVKESNPYAGFDLVIYNLAKIKELSDTAEFPQKKTEVSQKEGACGAFSGYLIETGDYPAEEIYVPLADDCYNPALFFSFTKDQYIYNIVPAIKTGFKVSGDPHVEVIDNFPEFFGVASTLKIIDIVRPRPVISKPRINAPKPFAETRRDSQGRMVCANKNDHPGKSNKGKGKHMDMECCLDPDEYPNPWCYYDPGKYGKYLK